MARTASAKRKSTNVIRLNKADAAAPTQKIKDAIVCGFNALRQREATVAEIKRLGIASNAIRDAFKVGAIASKLASEAATAPTEAEVSKARALLAKPNASSTKPNRRTAIEERWYKAANELWGSLTRPLVKKGDAKREEGRGGKREGSGSTPKAAAPTPAKGGKAKAAPLTSTSTPTFPTPYDLAAYAQQAQGTILLTFDKHVRDHKETATLSGLGDALRAAKKLVDDAVAALMIERDCATK